MRREAITIPAEALRIVPEPLWQSVQQRFRNRQASARFAPPFVSERGIRRRYWLAGFGSCALCGGSMQVVSRASTTGRKVRYACGTCWNRGATVCHNGLMADRATSDRAVRHVLNAEVLRPGVIQRALDIALDTLQREDRTECRVDSLRDRVARLDIELANLAETAALMRSPAARVIEPPKMRLRLRSFLDDWQQLLIANSAEARRVLGGALRERIRFEPDAEQRRYRLIVPIGFDRILVALVPEW